MRLAYKLQVNAALSEKGRFDFQFQEVPMDNTELQSKIASGVGGPELWVLRSESAIQVTSTIKTLGVSLSSESELTGKKVNSIRAMGDIMQMCGELGHASSSMLSTGQHYAGAALLRQIVEIEYLTWTFEKGRSDINVWLESTDKERMKMFSPAQLRKNAKGRFLSADYKNHCEQGGHPVPKGIPLLGGKSSEGAQLLIADLLLHCWRTCDQVRAWLEIQKYEPPKEIGKIYFYLTKWGEKDPLYKLMCAEQPDTDRRVT